MISYNTKEWIKPLVHFHRADTFRKLSPVLLAVGVYTLLVYLLERHILQLSEQSIVRNIPTMHSLLGFAISMLLVFRTNSAYDRWWEGRKLWGSLVNNIRNLSLKLHTMLPSDDKAARNFFCQLLGRFPHALHRHLRKEATTHSLDEAFDLEEIDFDVKGHMPVQISMAIHQRIYQLQQDKVLTDYQVLLLNAEMQSLLDICGGCERIKNTPIPYSYSSFIKKFIAAYVLTLPFGFVFVMGWISIPVVMFVFYVLASLEVIAEEIEDPFGNDINDLPTGRLALVIADNVKDIFNND